MGTKTIPQKLILICDRCGGEGERQKDGPFQYGGLHLKGENWGVGFGGDVGGCTVHYDFCTACMNDFSKWISAAIARRQCR